MNNNNKSQTNKRTKGIPLKKKKKKKDTRKILVVVVAQKNSSSGGGGAFAPGSVQSGSASWNYYGRYVPRQVACELISG